MIPDKLYDIIHSEDVDGDYLLLINSYLKNEFDSEIELEVRGGLEQLQVQKWKVYFKEFRFQKISLKWGEEIELFHEHFLIDYFLSPKAELHIETPPKSPSEAFIALKNSLELEQNHAFTVEDFLPFGATLSSVLEKNEGLIAKGPKSVLEVFEQVINQTGGSVIYKKEKAPLRYRGNTWLSENAQLKCLQIGDSYFVAEQIEFEELTLS